MSIRWNGAYEVYEFDTGTLYGQIEPFTRYHGVCGLMHRDHPLCLVKPRTAFLNAEYYIRPVSGLKMLPRSISREKKTTHELLDDRVVLHFPPEPEFGLHLHLSYRPHGDLVDLGMTIEPTKDVKEFDIFFASYVCEALDETWVPLRSPSGTREWKKLDNRTSLNEIFGIMREESMMGLLPARYEKHAVQVEERTFSEPMLVARSSANGLSLVFLCEPSGTRYLAGQYHGWDTAHDWAFGTDLQAGQEFEARARMVCRVLKDEESMSQEVAELWDSFDREAWPGSPALSSPYSAPTKRLNWSSRSSAGSNGMSIARASIVLA